jgi:hypothetical protein
MVRIDLVGSSGMGSASFGATIRCAASKSSAITWIGMWLIQRGYAVREHPGLCGSRRLWADVVNVLPEPHVKESDVTGRTMKDLVLFEPEGGRHDDRSKRRI